MAKESSAKVEAKGIESIPLTDIQYLIAVISKTQEFNLAKVLAAAISVLGWATSVAFPVTPSAASAAGITTFGFEGSAHDEDTLLLTLKTVESQASPGSVKTEMTLPFDPALIAQWLITLIVGWLAKKIPGFTG